MTTTARSRRGRVLIVGTLDDTTWGPRLETTPERVVDGLDAIGLVATAPARTPIRCVVLTQPAIKNERVGFAIKRVDPAVTVIALDDADERDADGTLARDATADDVRNVLEVEVAPEPVSTPPAPAPRATASEATRPTPSPPPDRAGGPGPLDGTKLGDTDLVDRLLENPAEFRSVAVALVRQHTGWHDLRWVDADHADAACPLRAEGAIVGALASDTAPPERLAAWGRWLERWLELEGRMAELDWMAYHDDLTGTWNRRYFSMFLDGVLATARERRRPVSVMVFDLDNFKHYNDAFGHEAGDVILCETVALLHSVIRDTDRVCRIGGDEFAVVFADLDGPRESGSTHPASVEKIVRRFQEQVSAMRFPKLGVEAPGVLGISAGLATFPWDGHDAVTLLRRADERALESKRKGKNRITIGRGIAPDRPGEPVQPDQPDQPDQADQAGPGYGADPRTP